MESTADLQRRVTSALRAHGSFMILQQSGPLGLKTTIRDIQDSLQTEAECAALW